MNYKIIAMATVLAASTLQVGCDDAVRTARKEFQVSSILKKYEWFKDASQALEAKNETIKVYEARQVALEKQYEGVARRDWARSDAEQSNVWSQELAGLKGSYNLLAAEYNANMAKFNWRFANQNDVPAGERPLPRSYTEK